MYLVVVDRCKLPNFSTVIRVASTYVVARDQPLTQFVSWPVATCYMEGYAICKLDAFKWLKPTPSPNGSLSLSLSFSLS